MVGIDWVRITAPESLLGELERWCRQQWGDTAQSRRGRNFFEGGYEFDGGAVLMSGHKAGICELSLPGALLGAVPSDLRVRWLRELLELDPRVECRRLDLAIDFIRQSRGVFDRVKEAIGDRHIFGARRSEVSESEQVEVKEAVRTTKGENAPAMRIVRIGMRGKLGSGRCVRVYDKGLETKTMQAGDWERWECEFYAEIAHKAARVVVGLDKFDMSLAEFIAGEVDETTEDQRMLMLALGCVDFRARDVSGRKDRSPRLAWWKDILKLCGERTRCFKQKARYSRLVKWMDWTARCVAPGQTRLAALAGVSIDQLLTTHAPPATDKPPSMRSAFWEWMYYLANPGQWEEHAHQDAADPPWLEIAREVLQRLKAEQQLA